MGGVNGSGHNGSLLVAAVCRTPILLDALDAAVAGVGVVHRYPAGGGDTAGLLRALEPDAVVVDSDEEAAEALAYSREAGSPLVHISLRENKVKVLVGGGWEEPDDGHPSPQALRNILVGKIATRGAVR